jgi:hypothetical protein
MNLRVLSLASLAALLTFAPAQAQQYRWIDRNGNVQFTDTPPPPGAKSVRKLDGGVPPSAASPADGAPVPLELGRLQAEFPVILYTSPNCREGCELARGALNKRGIPFKEVQVWNPETNEELKRVSGGDGVPTLLVGRSVQRGFEQGAFDLLLDSAGYPRQGLLPARSQKAPPPPEGYAAPEAAKPVEAASAAQETRKAGPYDTSRLQGPPQKLGPYGIPGETK